MPHIDYPSVIHESAEDLLALEHWLRGQRTEARVRMLRLLKSGHAPPSPGRRRVSPRGKRPR